MPQTKSAQKALRQNARHRRTNLQRQKDLKSVIKTYKKLLETDKKDEAQKELPKVYKKLDKLAKVNFIKKGKANRLKSRLSKKLNT